MPVPPPTATSFIGRAEQVSELAELLDGSRLLTLTGAPGIGKSRLALELATGLVDCDRYPDGARLVELAPLADPALVPRALASALSIDEVPGQDLTDTIATCLRERRLLLVLDNCEHLLDGCRKLVDALLSGCPELRIVATTREVLGLDSEQVWRVPPLPVPQLGEPASPKALASYAAVALFVERAAGVQPGFALNAHVAPAVAEICRRLDGIPLAIELAAARVEVLSPAEIAARLEDRFGLLANGNQSGLSRHQTLEAALDWSHELLSEAERALLRRLSVFVGGFELESAEAVCAGGQIESARLEASAISDVLVRLVSKSLLAADAGSPYTTRYRLLETIRAYAADRLEQAGETAALRRAHARYHLTLAERAEPELTGPNQQRWLERLEAERSNLRSAVEWSLSHGEAEWALRMVGALVLFWRVRSHFSEGRELLEAALSAGEGAPEGLRAKALWGAGFMTLMAGEIEGAIAALDESLARFRELADRGGCARVLLILGNCAQYRYDPTALSLLEESAALAREAGDPWCLCHALGVAGFENSFRGEPAAARALFDECLAVAREAQDQQGLCWGLLGLGVVCAREGDHRSAQEAFEKAATVTAELGEDYDEATALRYLAQLATAQGDYCRARELLDESEALTPQASPPDTMFGLRSLRAELAHAEGDRQEAQRLFEESLALARSGDGTPVLALAALQGMAAVAADQGALSAAGRLFEEALELARADGDTRGSGNALHGLGELARAEGNLKRAAALHDEALELRSEDGDLPGIAASLEAVAGLDPAAGGYEHSARLLGAAQALREANGYARAPWEQPRYDDDVAAVRRALGSRRFDAVMAEGADLSIDEAVVEALKRQARRGRPPTGWSSLTQSERQVAARAAEGLTNPEIAERLFISPSTVKFHLSNVFAKLGVEGRTELAREVGRRSQQRPGTDE